MALMDRTRRLTAPVRRLFTADELPGPRLDRVSQALLDAAFPNAVTAAASRVPKAQSSFLQHTQEWQSEAWTFYDSLAEVNTGVWWLANMLSRVRLKAAELSSDPRRMCAPATPAAAPVLPVSAAAERPARATTGRRALRLQALSPSAVLWAARTSPP